MALANKTREPDENHFDLIPVAPPRRNIPTARGYYRRYFPLPMRVFNCAPRQRQRALFHIRLGESPRVDGSSFR